MPCQGTRLQLVFSNRFRPINFFHCVCRLSSSAEDGASTEFVALSQLDIEDSDDGDDDESSFRGSHSSINFSSSSVPPSHEGSPFHKRVFKTAHDDLTSAAMGFRRTQSDAGRPRADSDSLTTAPRSRLTRKGAMSGSQRKDLQRSREKMIERRTLSLERNRNRRERSTSPLLIRRSHTPSPPSSRASNSPPRPLSVTSGEDLAQPLIIKQQVSSFPNPPVITIRRPSTPVNPHLSRDDRSGKVTPQPLLERDDLSSDVGPESYRVRDFAGMDDLHADKKKTMGWYGNEPTNEQQEKPREGIIDRGRPPVSTQPQAPESPKHAPFWSAKPENDVEASDTRPEGPTHSPRTGKHKPIRTPQKQTPEDEFKKVKVGSSVSHKYSGGKPPSKADKATSPASKPATATPPSSKPDKPVSPAHSISDEFKKVVIPSSDSAIADADEFRKVKSGQPEEGAQTHKLADIGKQDSVTSTASETSIGKPQVGALSSVDSRSSVDSVPTVELQPSVEPQPPAEPQYKWKRKGARRVTKSQGTRPTVEATDDFEIVDMGSEVFHHRARSGAISKPHSSEGSMPRPGEFRKVKSPVPVKPKDGGLLEREQFSRPRSYSGGGSSLERRGGKRRAEKTLSGVTVASEHGEHPDRSSQ